MLAARRAGVALFTLVLLVACSSGSEEPPPTGPDCGKAVTKADGARWKCTFSEDFTGSRLDPRKWLTQRTDNSGYRIGPECYGRAQNVQVGGGVVRLTAKREKAPFLCKDPNGDYTTSYSGASISTYDRFAQAYGRFEIRAKMPSSPTAGIHSALWLWPQEQARFGAYPASGEIDIAEYYGAYPDRLIPYVHYVPAAADPATTNNNCIVNDPSRWHRYLVEWTPASIAISYDGRPCIVDQWSAAPPLTGRQPFDSPFFVVLTQGLGAAATANAFTDATKLPATMTVDWVRVWS